MTPAPPPDALDALRLIRSHRVGVSTWHRLMGEHGTAAAALAALPGIARAAGIDTYQPCPEGVARAELAAGRKLGARLVVHGGPGYPAALADLADAPPVLWLRGRADLPDRPGVAMVGARNASSLGRRMARALAETLGQAGLVVISGLARGIDAAAHEAALPHGTIAVLAGGVDVTYPQENAALMAQIAETGLILSEMPPGLQPQARHFPMRNRIISGLARAVVVVEAAAKSGSLITARDALDQGREVMAVPGHPFDARAAGCNQLIRDGALLVRGGEDVLAALGPRDLWAPLGAPPTAAPRRPQPPAAPPRPARQSPGADALRAQVLTLIGPAPVAEDQVLRDLALPAQALSECLLALELDGVIERQPGGLLARVA